MLYGSRKLRYDLGRWSAFTTYKRMPSAGSDRIEMVSYKAVVIRCLVFILSPWRRLHELARIQARLLTRTTKDGRRRLNLPTTMSVYHYSNSICIQRWRCSLLSHIACLRLGYCTKDSVQHAGCLICQWIQPKGFSWLLDV